MRLLDESGEGLNKMKELLKLRWWNENVNVKCKCERDSMSVGISEINKNNNK